MGQIEPVEVTEQNFQEEVMDSEIPVVLEFWSPKCSHCMKMHKVLDALAEELGGLVSVVKVNVLENVELARPFGVSQIPAFFYLVEGRVMGAAVGAMSKGKLKEELNLSIGRA